MPRSLLSVWVEVYLLMLCVILVGGAIGVLAAYAWDYLYLSGGHW